MPSSTSLSCKMLSLWKHTHTVSAGVCLPRTQKYYQDWTHVWWKLPRDGKQGLWQAQMLKDSSERSIPDFFPWSWPSLALNGENADPCLPTFCFSGGSDPPSSYLCFPQQVTLSFLSVLCRYLLETAALGRKNNQLEGASTGLAVCITRWPSFQHLLRGEEGSYCSWDMLVLFPVHLHLVHAQESHHSQFTHGIKADRGHVTAHI